MTNQGGFFSSEKQEDGVREETEEASEMSGESCEDVVQRRLHFN